MTTIYIVPIEPIDQRYTRQWYENIPAVLAQEIQDRGLDFSVETIDGEQPETGTTAGAFLDFAVTNIYKAEQTKRIAALFSAGKIKAGDKFLVTDAWNPVITSIRYMSELLDTPVEIHSIWHAGAYDPTDILGMKMKKPWPSYQELAWYYASDYNYYATMFHKNMFLKNLGASPHKAFRSGQPHDLALKQLEFVAGTEIERRPEMIMWPHRYNSDKQPEIAEDLGQVYNVTITQKMNLNKATYYGLMREAGIIFSCALHENLGISVMEGTILGAIPVVPQRASYAEMYMDEFLYPSEWTESWDAYMNHRDDLHNFISDRIRNREKYLPALARQQEILRSQYMRADAMIERILGLEQ